jgi:predicted O-methyltransferase YrrM
MQHLNDPTGISIEEGELLYGLIRTTKPMSVLETGTNIGVSASYIALALKDNGLGGKLTTIEHDGTVANAAREKFRTMGLDNVTVLNLSTHTYFAGLTDEKFDFLWLDTELKERYNELLTLFPRVVPGGIICIHDLWMLDFDWFGGVPEAMKALFRGGNLRALTFQTEHGVTVFQKRRENDYLADLFRSL